MRSTSGLPSNTAANRGSTITVNRKSGRNCFSSVRAGVVSTQSPSDRSRITAIRAPEGRRSSKFSTFLFFDTGFVDQHYGNIVANRIYTLAFDALEAVFILLQFERRLAQGTHENVQQVLADGHSNRSV